MNIFKYGLFATALAATLTACPPAPKATTVAVTGPASLQNGAAPAAYNATFDPASTSGSVQWTLNPTSGVGTLSASTSTIAGGVATVNYTPPVTVATATPVEIIATLQGSSPVVTNKFTVTVNPTASQGITVAGTVWKWNNKPFGGLSVTITDSSGNKPEVTTANNGNFSVPNVITPYKISVVPAQATEVLPISYDRMTSASPQVVLAKVAYTTGAGGGLPGFENECSPPRVPATIIATLDQAVAAASVGRFFFVGEGISFRPLLSFAQSTVMNPTDTTRTFAVPFDQNFCKLQIVGKLIYIERNQVAGGNGSVTKIASRNVTVTTGNTYCGDDAAATCGTATPTSKLSVITRAGSRIRGKIFWPQGVNQATAVASLRFSNNEATDVPAYVQIDTKVITRTAASDDYELAVVDFADEGLDYRASGIAQDVSGTQFQWYHSDRIAANAQNVALPVSSLGETQTPNGDFTQTEFGGRGTQFTQGQVSSSEGATSNNSNFYFRYYQNPGLTKYWLGGTPLQTMSLPEGLRLPAVVALNELFNWQAVNALSLRDANTTNGSDIVTSINSGASRPYGVLRNLYGFNALYEPDLIKFGSINLKQTCFAVITGTPRC